MRFKHIYFIISMLLIGSFFYGCSSINVADKESKSKKILLIYAKGDVYKTDWKKVDSLEQNGLTKSALTEVKTILNKAEDEANHQQLIKALLIKAKLQSYVEEDVFVKTIQELTLEATKSSYPADPLIHSIIAEMYWQYYQRNRWRIQNRTATINFKNDDILTWDLNKIIEVTTQQYLLSIEDIESLKRTPTETFSEIIIVDSASHYRPFLYDFLAHRAIDFFMNEQANITKPVYEFLMDSSHYLSSYKYFAKIDLHTKDSSSLKFHALQTLQNLTLNHLNDTNPTALIDVDLKRLKFVKSNAVFQDKDSLYYKSLSLLYNKFSDFPSSTEIVFELASTHQITGSKYKAVEAEGYKWELQKAVNLCISAIKKFPNSYGASKCRVLENQIKMKQLSVVAEKVNTPNTPLKANITFKNIDKVFFRLVKVDFDEYKKWNRNSKKDIRFKNIVESEKVKEWDLDLQNEGDFQSHSGEFKMDGLPLGFYILLTSSSTEFSVKNEAVAVTPFWVSNLSYLTRTTDSGGVEFFVLNRESGVPLKDVTAKLYYQNYSYISRKYEWKYIGTKTTNENGSFSVKSSVEYRNIYADFFIDKDRLNTQDSYYQYKFSEPQKKIRTRTIFFTDRAIYRPGQTVYFKGIVLDTDHLKNNNIKTNFKSTIELYDVNSQKISELNLVTNEYS
ncbi:MAG: MG2 domain-containing protein [Vicingaceae bacterium]